MAERNFIELIDAQAARGNHLSVGIDIDWNKVDPSFGEPSAESIFQYGKLVIDSTAEEAAMFKPNIEFYAAYRKKGGYDALARLVDYSKTHYPEVAVSVDAKQGDIGRTNEMALEGVFGELGDPDAMTVHPWMGRTAMETHLDMGNKGIIVIAKTSNPGSGEFQDLPVPEEIDMEALLEQVMPTNASRTFKTKFLNEGLTTADFYRATPNMRFRPLWQMLSRHVTSPEGWNYNGNAGVVIGATYEGEAQTARANAGEGFILSPGLGTQDGVVVDMRNSKGSGVVYNSASGIMLPKAEMIKPGESLADCIGRLAAETNLSIKKALQIIE